MATTLRDVAQMAGVSISTASRALTADQTRVVATETRERIWEAVRQLHYQPKDAAQRLVNRVDSRVRRTYNIGLILGQVSYKFSDPFWSPVLDGVDEELIRQEYHLRFAFTFDDLARPSQRQLLSHAHIDGVILLGTVPPSDWISTIGRDRTVIVSNLDGEGRWHEQLPADIIAIEKRRALYRLVDHLVALGRRRFGFLGPPPTTDERAEAFLHALARHDLPLDPAHFLRSPWPAEGAYEVAKTLFSGGNIPDALVCACDTIAIGAMRAAKEYGLRLPDDLAITGFDDISFARDLDPPLTTIHVPKELLGELAVRKLIERISHPDRPPVVQTVQTTLVVRGSCGGARSTPAINAE
ncbi:MAG TPA: LacI family DNA-binding transcriptional regulator [Chloroflexota bacterium]|nr:LacI family DNA-binding transcriptional regulator [Chloroflexota bacterium]